MCYDVHSRIHLKFEIIEIQILFREHIGSLAY